jgi:uncharacterized RDD family membrane protein YckC
MKIIHLFTRLACTALACWSVLIAPPQLVAIDVEQNEPATEQKNSQDVVRVGGNVTIGPGETCKDLVVVLGSVTMEGTAQNDVVVILGNLTINGDAQGDVVNILGTTKIGPNAKIKGDLVTVLGGQSISPSAQINGQRVEVSPRGVMPHFDSLGEFFHEGIGRARPLAPGLSWMWMLMGISLLLYLLVALVFPKPVATCAKVLETRPVASMLTGLIAFVFTGPLILLLVLSLVGILVIPFIACGMVALLVFGKAAIYQFTGLQIGRQAKVDEIQHPLIALAIGFVVFCLLYMVPILGLLVWGVLIPLGFGCALLALFGGLKREHAEVKPAPIPPAPMPPGYPMAPVSPLPPGFDTQGQNSPPPAAPTLNAIVEPGMPPVTQTPPLTSTPPDTTAMPKTISDPGMPPLTSPPPFTATPPFASPPPSASGALPSATPPPFVSPAAVPDVSHLEMAALPRATLLQRAGAIALDFLLMAIILVYLHLYHGWLILWLGYHIAMWTWKGTTVGGVVMGLKVVRQNGRPIDAPVAAVRCLGSVLSTVALGLGFFRIAWKEDRLSWHDQIAGTMVVHVPKGVPLISV